MEGEGELKGSRRLDGVGEHEGVRSLTKLDGVWELQGVGCLARLDIPSDSGLGFGLCWRDSFTGRTRQVLWYGSHQGPEGVRDGTSHHLLRARPD